MLRSRGVDSSQCLYKSELVALAADCAALPPAPAALEQLHGAQLVAALRAEPDPTATARVHALQLAAWRRDPRFGGMARHLLDDVHPIFRRAFASVLAESERSGAVDGRGFASANSHLAQHHATEDAMWFPALRALHGAEMAAQVDLLESDHADLVALEARVKRGEMEALRSFCDALRLHLDREELLTVPLLMQGTGGF